MESYIPFLKNLNAIENISLDSIWKSLNESVSRCIVLHGPPGIGKTTNALNFSYHVREEHDWTVLWFNSDTKDKFCVDLQSITHLISEKSDHNKNKAFEYLIELNNLRPTLFMAVHKTQNLEETKLFDANIEAFTREFILFNNLIVDLVLPTRNYLINLIVKSFDILEKF